MNFGSRTSAALLDDGRKRRIAKLSAAAAMVVGIGTASALFVDYLADRALARSESQTAKPQVAAPVEVVADASAPPVATQPLAETAVAPAPLPAEPIEAPLPDPAAIAKVTAGAPIDPSIGSQADDAAALDTPFPEEDSTKTGAIAFAEEQKTAKKKAPAEKPADKAADVQQDEQVAALPGVDVGIDDKSADIDAAAPTNGVKVGGSARVRQAVNMRSSPQKGASVIGVVPANSAVGVISCDGWCQISFNDRTGWVYKSFLSNVTRQQVAKPAKEENSAPAPRRVQSSRL